MPIERDQAADLLSALVSLIRAGRTVAQRDAEHSVSATPMMLLRLLRDSEPRLGDLADRLRVKPSVASRAVAALESSGYVARVADPDDARACRVQLTDAGRQHLADREEHALSELARTFDDWSTADAESAVRVLGRLETGLTQWVSTLEHHDRRADSPTDETESGQTEPDQSKPDQSKPDQSKEMYAA